MGATTDPCDFVISIDTVSRLTGRVQTNIQRDIKNILKSTFLSSKFKEHFNPEYLTKVGFEYYLMSLSGNGIEAMKESWMHHKQLHLLNPVTLDTAKFVYIITNEAGHTKCGITNDMDTRMRAFKTGNSGHLNIHYLSVKLENAFEVERIVHTRFKKDNIKGEWFNRHPDVIADFLRDTVDEIGIVASR